MLIKGISLISVVATAILYLNGAVENAIYIPVTFVIGFVLLFMLWAISCVICTFFIDKNKSCDRHSPIFRFYSNCIIDTLMQILRVKLHVSGTEILPKEKFLFVGNHRSSMDPILQMGVLRKYNIGFIAKQELFRIPAIGKLMHKCFCLSLNRGDPREDVKAIISAAELIKNQTAAIGIYPEGTRNKGEGLLPFKNGAFKIAQKAKCPIVVAKITNSEQIMKNAPFKKTNVHIDFIGVLDADFVAENSTVIIGDKVKAMLESNCKASL